MKEETALVKLPDFGREIALPSDWIEKRERALIESTKIKTVSTQAEYEMASEALSRVTRCSNGLEKQRAAFGKPFNEIVRKIKKMCDAARFGLEHEKKRVKRLLSDYVAEQERKKREAQAQAEAKARREAERQFAEQQAREEETPSIFDEPPEPIKVETEPAPVVEEARSSASRVTKRIVWELEDLEQVPRAFLMLDSRKVNEWLRMQKDAVRDGIEKGSDGRQYVAGIRFELVTDVSGRG